MATGYGTGARHTRPAERCDAMNTDDRHQFLGLSGTLSLGGRARGRPPFPVGFDGAVLVAVPGEDPDLGADPGERCPASAPPCSGSAEHRPTCSPTIRRQ